MFTLKLGILRVLVFFALRCKLYYMWSRLYRAINRNLAWDVALPKIGNEEELTKILATLKWAADDWTELWDAIATPQQAWAMHRAGKPVGDCLPAGTLLLTDNYELVPIEDVAPGMKIMGDAKPTEIKAAMSKGQKRTLIFKLTNGCNLQCTGDHRLFVLRNGKYDEVRARDVRVGDVLRQPSESFWYGKGAGWGKYLAKLYGLYIADGWHEDYRFAISGKDGCPKEKNKEWVQDFCKGRDTDVYWHPRYIRITDKELTAGMRDCGRCAINKHIPTLNLTKDELTGLLEGLSADACNRSDCKSITHGTISKQLAVQLRVLYRILGFSTNITKVVKHGGLGANPIYRITPRMSGHQQHKKCRIIAIADGGVHDTYDITTDSGCFYLPESDVIVHNCDEYSVISAELLRPFLSGLPFPITRGGYITILEVGILSVPWTWPGGTSGHNVCMFSYVSGSNKYWAYVGNWFGGGVRWGFHSREELIKDILKIVKGRGVNRISALGAAYVKPDLQLVKWWSAKSF